MQKTLSRLVLALAITGAAGCHAQNRTPSDQLCELADHFEVSLSFDPHLRADSVHIGQQYGAPKHGYKLTWNGNTANTINNPKVTVSTGFGKKWKFSLDKLPHNMAFLERIMRPMDTLRRDQVIRGGLTIEDDIFLRLDSRTIVQYNRFGGTPIKYQLTDSLARASMQTRYGRDVEFNTINYLNKNTGIELKHEFSDMQVSSDTISLWEKLTTAEFGASGDTAIKSTQYLLKYKAGKLLGIYPIIHGEFVQDNYYVIGSSFIEKGNSCYVQLGRKEVAQDNRMLGEFRRDGNNYVFMHLLPDTLPSENMVYKFYYTSTELRKAFPYYIPITSSSLRNVLTGREYRLNGIFASALDKSASIVTNFMRHVVLDVQVDQRQYAYLVTLEDGFFYYLIYDLNNGITVEKKKMWERSNKERSRPNIDKWDGRYIIYSDNNYIVRQKV